MRLFKWVIISKNIFKIQKKAKRFFYVIKFQKYKINQVGGIKIYLKILLPTAEHEDNR